MPLTADQKNQLVAVYDEAVAAGDQAAVGRIRDALARDRMEASAAAPKRTAETSALNAEESNYGVSNKQAAEASAEGFSAVAEGGRRAVAGIKQVGAGIADAFTRKDKAGRGLKAEVTAAEVLRQKMDQIETKEQGGQGAVDFRNGVASVAEAGAMALAPEAGLPRATTLAGGLVKNAAAGGLGGLATFDQEGKNVQNAEIGAGVAAAIGAPLAVAPAIKNRIAVAINDAVAGSRTERAAANAVRGNPGAQFSLSQRTGIPELKTLERAAYNSEMTNFYADQTDQFIENFTQVMRQPVAAGRELEPTFLEAQTRARELLATAKMNSSNAYEAGMSRAATMNQPAAGAASQVAPVAIPATDYRGQLQTLVQRAQDPVEGISPELARQAQAWLDDAQRGTLNPRELAAHLRGLTRTIKAGGDAGAQAGRLRDALERDLDNLPQNGTLAANDTAQQIMQTRAEYRRSRQAIDAMQTSAAYKLLGVADPASVTSDDLLTKFKTFTPEKQRQVRGFLDTEAPDLLTSMKQQIVDDARTAAQSMDPAADSRQSLDQMVDNLFDEKRGFGLRSSGLWSADELRRVEEFKDGVRVIRNNRPTPGGAGTPIKPEDIVINLVSRSGEFASRQLARILMSSRASELFTDPAVYDAMRAMNRSTTGSAANLAARTALLGVLQDNYSEEEQK